MKILKRKDVDFNHTVTVMTLNTWLVPTLPTYPFFDLSVSRRARTMADFLRKQNGVDIFLLQEVWSGHPCLRVLNALFASALLGRSAINDALVNYRKTGITRMAGKWWSSMRTFLDSGLMVCSLDKIEKHKFVQFVSTGRGKDSYCGKGVVFAYTNRTIVANTHLCSGAHNAAVREEQLRQLACELKLFQEEVDAHVAREDESVSEGTTLESSNPSCGDKARPITIVAGDFAIDANTNEDEYNTLAEIMAEFGLRDAAADKGAIEPWDGMCTAESFQKSGITFFHKQDVKRPERRDLIFTDADIKHCGTHDAYREDTHEKKGIFRRGVVSDHCPLHACLYSS